MQLGMTEDLRLHKGCELCYITNGKLVESVKKGRCPFLSKMSGSGFKGSGFEGISTWNGEPINPGFIDLIH
jgi:hypothetical protein